MNYFFAPVQGHTDAAFRDAHAAAFGSHAEYFTPFLRCEKGEIRRKDMKDAESALSSSSIVTPQVIFRDADELNALVSTLVEMGHSRIDINMGCPFPLQTARGRGAATISRPECADAVKDVVLIHPDVVFSVKMRLGMEQPDEWKPLMETLNSLPLRHITLHPRTARDQYSGNLRMDSFQEFLSFSNLPVVFNGELHSPQDVKDIVERFPNIHGVMIGRGAIARPSIFAECIAGEEIPAKDRLTAMLQFHNSLLDHYQNSLIGGSHQVLDKIKPFWEYAENEIGRKAWKAIRKASNMAKYETAVAMIDSF